MSPLPMNSSASITTNDTHGTRGWVHQSGDRGTLDIIISCGITTFLCIWTAVCVNVPAPEHKIWDIFRDRWHMFCLGMLGPEFILLCAVGEYCSARKSVQAFASSKHFGWTMRHAFFAEMGGIHLQIPGIPSFPINSKQLHFLITVGYIRFPDITVDDIDDKNKVDGLTRLISTIQILWFTLSTITRPIKGYAVTTLEITTLGYILCALGILFFWKYKPMDIRTPIVLECPLPLSAIIDQHGHSAASPYHITPLDFVGRDAWITNRLWDYYVNLLRRMRIVHSRQKSLPRRRFSSFNFPVLTQPMIFLMLGFSFTYAGIFVAGWNFHFPTRAEKLLWRMSSLGSMIIVVIGATFEVVMIFLEHRKCRLPSQIPDVEMDEIPQRFEPRTSPEMPTRWERVLASIRNVSSDKDPLYDVPIRSLLITTPCCALYTMFRVIILIEDIITLRELPASAFSAIEWSTYVPHI